MSTAGSDEKNSLDWVRHGDSVFNHFGERMATAIAPHIADRIVGTVNSHSDLVSACEGMVIACETARQVAGNKSPWTEILDLLKPVLAKAKRI